MICFHTLFRLFLGSTLWQIGFVSPRSSRTKCEIEDEVVLILLRLLVSLELPHHDDDLSNWSLLI